MIVLVTGGSTGIGLAIVRRLVGAGHRVYAASREPRRAQLPEGATPVVLDVASPESTRRALDEVMADAGRIDVLVKIAGTGYRGAVEETGEKECRRVFDVNFFGPLRLARLVVPVMRAQGGGRIINITSMNDVLAAPFAGLYSASKAALSSASAVLGGAVEECLAGEVPPARMVVGRDAEAFDKLLREAAPEDSAAMLRDYVGQLISAGGGAG